MKYLIVLIFTTTLFNVFYSFSQSAIVPTNQYVANNYNGSVLFFNKINNPCSFNTGIKNDIIIKPARNKYIEMVNDICKILKTENIYVVVEAPIGNAASIIYEGHSFIIIDDIFVENIIKNTGTNFSLVGIIGHEIGHHISGHTKNSIKESVRPEAELEADYIAGKVLYSSDAETLDDYYGVIDYLIPFEIFPANVYSDYPGNQERKNAIFSGAINNIYFPIKSYKYNLPIESEIKKIELEIVNFLTKNKLNLDWANEFYNIKNRELIITDSSINITKINISKIIQINFQPFEACCLDFIAKKEGITLTDINNKEVFKTEKCYTLTETMDSEYGAANTLVKINELITKLMYLYSISK